MEHVSQSPFARALGDQLRTLPPSLQTYFRGVPRGSVGIGEGTFARIGTPRRWLWPILRWFERRGAVLSGWHEDVPFTVYNRVIAGRAIAERVIALPAGTWTMRDSVAQGRHGRVVDQLGEPAVLVAVFDVTAEDDAVVLRSTAVGLRPRGKRLRLPGFVAPRITLTEKPAADGGQQVSLTVDAPLIGRIYEYSGTFRYRVDEESS